MKGFAVITTWVSLCTFVMLIMTPQKTNGLPAGRKTNGLLVNLTILESGVSKGAVCLDGSPPAYNFAPGFGQGVNNWLVHFEGGGWCHNVTNCLYRSRRGRLGTSKAMKTTSFNGILNDRMELNPDFYNWNKIKIRYCDGSSYTGDVESVDPRTNLHYRGARIFVAVMEELLAKGMKNAENALLSGCSAGGLASLLHCDRFRALLPASARVKCLSDAGFFVNAKDITGVEYMRGFFKDIATTHNSAKNLPPACTSRLRPDMCFFPQYMVKHIETPFFLLNSAYDSWQIRNVLVPPGADPEGTWDACRSDISLCNTEQIQAMQVFREEFLKAVGRFGQRPSAGMFINSCFAHCQTELTRMWHAPNSPVLGNLTVADAVGKWFFDRGEFKKVDCPYPCDTSCQTMKYPNPKGHVDPDSPQEPGAAAAAAAAPAAENPGMQPQDRKPAAGAPKQNPAGQPQDHDKPAVRRDPEAPAAGAPEQITPAGQPQDHDKPVVRRDPEAPAAGAPEQNPAGQPQDHDKPVRRDPEAPAAGAPEQITPAGRPQDHDKPAVRRDPEAPAAGAPDEKINPAGASPDQAVPAGAPPEEINTPAGASPDQAVPAGAPEEINPGRSQLAPAGAPDQEEGAHPPVEGPADHQARYRNLDQPSEKADLSEGNPAKSSQEWQLTLKRHLFLLPAASLVLFYLM